MLLVILSGIGIGSWLGWYIRSSWDQDGGTS